MLILMGAQAKPGNPPGLKHTEENPELHFLVHLFPLKFWCNSLGCLRNGSINLNSNKFSFEVMMRNHMSHVSNKLNVRKWPLMCLQEAFLSLTSQLFQL